MRYPLDNALYQWEEGDRRLRELSEDPRVARRLARVVEGVRDELRRVRGENRAEQAVTIAKNASAGG